MDKTPTLQIVLEAIANFGRQTAGSAVLGGKQSRPRKTIKRATLTRRAARETVSALRKDTKTKAQAARDAQAHQEYQQKIEIEKHRASQYRV